MLNEILRQNPNMDMAKVSYSAEEQKTIELACKVIGVTLPDDWATNLFYKPVIDEFMRGYNTCKACDGKTCDSSIKGFRPLIDNNANISYAPCKIYERIKEAFRALKHRESAGIPKLYKAMTFDNLEVDGNAQTVGMAKELASGSREKGLYLFGTPGVGKTHIAMAVLQEHLNHGSGLFYTMPTLANELRTLAKDDEKLTEIINKIKDADLLVLDDFGAEKWTEYIGERMFSILNDRNANQKLLIITSNLSLDELADKMADQGERLGSRIKGMCDVRHVVGRDRRLD